MVTSAPAPHVPPSPAAPPHHVIVRLGGGVTDALLIAMVEGQARLIGAALTRPDGADCGVSAGIAQLAAHTGFPLTPDLSEIAGVILDTGPFLLMLIGERTENDANALSTLHSLGVVRYFSIASLPPRHPERHPDWLDAIVTAWQRGQVDAVLVDVPEGALPVWVAQLFNAVGVATNPPPLLVIAADPSAAALAPPSARTLTRDDHLPEQLSAALSHIQCLRLLPTCITPPVAMYRRQALVTAIVAAQRATGKTICYIDIADGTTVIGTDGTQANITYEPLRDCGAGTPALLTAMRAEALARWFPTDIDLDSARRWALRRAAWPTAILTDRTDRMMAGAFARLLIEQFGAVRADVDSIILGPGWLRWAGPDDMLSVISDVIAPQKPIQIALDADDLVAAAGLLARVRPESAETVFAYDALRPIGTVIAAPADKSQSASRLQATLTTAGVAERRAIDGEGVLRLPISTDAMLELTRDGMATSIYSIVPSECGLVIDTRQRPLSAPRASQSRGTVSDRLRTVS